MKRFSLLVTLTLTLAFPWMEGCRNGPTSAGNNNSGWNETTPHAPWTARYGIAGTVFNGNMWVIGGANGSGSVTNYCGDVWKSSDGQSWTHTANPGFGGRYGSRVVTFNNQLYLIGGNSNGTLMNDVWTSTDGVTWTQILANNSFIQSTVIGGTQFCPREDFTAVVFNNLIWVISGTPNPSNTTSIGLNDVWSSPDAITWTQVLANAPGVTLGTATTQFPARWGSAAVSFNNNIYLMCGHDSGTGVNTVDADTWSSANGSTWNLVANNFTPVYYHQMVVNNNTMVSSCGYAPWRGGAFNGINISTTWTNWNSAGAMPFPARFGHLSLSFNNQVWIIGGCDNTDSLTYYNDVWHSP